MLATRGTFKFQRQLLNLPIGSGTFEHLLQRAVVDVAKVLMAAVESVQDLLLFSRLPLVLFCTCRLITCFIRCLFFLSLLVCCWWWLLASESTS